MQRRVIVMGKDAASESIPLYDVSVQITSEYSVSQPGRLPGGNTAVVANTDVYRRGGCGGRLSGNRRRREYRRSLVGGLHNMGATARDVISILQAIKAAGALDADLEMI